MSDDFLKAIGMEGSMYTVDLPNPYNVEGPWVTVKTGTYEEVIEFVRKVFGADSDGKIEIIGVGCQEESDADTC